MSKLLYQTELGRYFTGDSEKVLTSEVGDELQNKVQLIFTSPPFPLNTKKRYGNLNGDEYKKWIINFSEIFSDLLKEDGSIVIELGNAWEMGRPIQSLLNLETLLGFVNNPKANLRLCQEFICYNPSRLPSPAQWVTIKRIRVVDSFTHIWWMSKSDYPKADNKKVLRPYSKDMNQILKSKKYNAGKRPSAHNINKRSFITDNSGSIMPNIIELEPIKPNREVRLPSNVFSIANTQSNDFFLQACRKTGVVPHPARMPLELANFFIDFLTDPGDIILDPFAGSNTTGFCAEKLGRKWISIEIDEDLGKQSIMRFQDPSLAGE
ncbi:MAG: site-specific DNA-methyltransferase [Methanothrix sp.]|nr:site-specific DNA-methyltransferase [Methanothrix sp.]